MFLEAAKHIGHLARSSRRIGSEGIDDKAPASLFAMEGESGTRRHLVLGETWKMISWTVAKATVELATAVIMEPSNSQA